MLDTVVVLFVLGGGDGEGDVDEDDDDLEELSMVDIRQRILAAGFTESQLMDCINEVRLCLLKARKA